MIQSLAHNIILVRVATVHIVLLPQCKDAMYVLFYCCIANCLKICSTINQSDRDRTQDDHRWPGRVGDTWKSDLPAFEMDLGRTAVSCKYIVYRWEKGPAVELENPSCSVVGGFPSQCVGEFEMDSNLWLLYSPTSRPLAYCCSSNSVCSSFFGLTHCEVVILRTRWPKKRRQSLCNFDCDRVRVTPLRVTPWEWPVPSVLTSVAPIMG